MEWKGDYCTYSLFWFPKNFPFITKNNYFNIAMATLSNDFFVYFFTVGKRTRYNSYWSLMNQTFNRRVFSSPIVQSRTRLISMQLVTRLFKSNELRVSKWPITQLFRSRRNESRNYSNLEIGVCRIGGSRSPATNNYIIICKYDSISTERLSIELLRYRCSRFDAAAVSSIDLIRANIRIENKSISRSSN